MAFVDFCGESMEKVCSFFGYRKIKETEDLVQCLRNKIVELIEQYGVKIFLFGSRSDFDELCHRIVTELRVKYPDLQRRAYTCRSETCILENERGKWEKIYSEVKNREVHLLGVEQEVEHKNKWTAGRASYVERNQAMIDDSDYCIFYYNPYYQPPRRKYSKCSFGDYQPKSGTQLALDYAYKRKRAGKELFILNVFEEEDEKNN